MINHQKAIDRLQKLLVLPHCGNRTPKTQEKLTIYNKAERVRNDLVNRCFDDIMAYCNSFADVEAELG